MTGLNTARPTLTTEPIMAVPPRRAARMRGAETIPAALIEDVCRRLLDNKQVRRTLPLGGRLHIDRQLPFLCVYRQPADRTDLGTERLVKSEASYLVVADNPAVRGGLRRLLRRVAATLTSQFGAFMIIELWSSPDGGRANDPAVPSILPTFSIFAPAESGLNRAVEELERRLRKIKVLKQGVEVAVTRDAKPHPPQMRPLLSVSEARDIGCTVMGLEIPPVYRKPDDVTEFPLVMRTLRRSVGLALRHAFYEFSRSQTTHRPAHYHELGRRAVVKAVWDVDRKLAEVSSSFDYLIQLTPVNTRDAFREFRRGHFQKTPQFHYRPQPIDPGLLQRQLYNIPIERVEDPALQRLFVEKQEELDIKITMLRDRDTPRFLYESLQLFGGVDDDLLRLAHGLLENTPVGRRTAKKRQVTAREFAARAEAQFATYRAVCPQFAARVRVGDDISGLMVSRGKLLIPSDMRLPPERVDALLAHEVGTHLVTYYNGKTQPFQQLYSGLAGYEELQEGLAVLAELLVGGLSRARVRQLAGRVVAARNLADGASFIDTFRLLDRTYEFSQQGAYNITMRIYRGGGLTKDAVYLRGLRQTFDFLQEGGDLEAALAGKMAAGHIPIIKELQYRKVLQPTPIRPVHVTELRARARLDQIRNGGHRLADVLANPSVLEGNPKA